MSAPTAATRLYALLGDPVGHSLSPAFQNAAFRALGLDAVYVALRCSAEDVPGLVRGIARAGGGGNVTVPHKETAARAVDVASEAVRITGACNAFWLQDGAVHGDNTDVEGAEQALRRLLGDAPPRSALLVGAGGSARALLLALIRLGAQRVVIINRSPARAAELRARFEGMGAAIEVRSPADDLSRESFDVAVNSTPLGMREGDALPPTGGARFAAAFDAVYSRAGTRWVAELAGRGIPALDGKEMLLHQGAGAFRRWWGVEPPLEVMRAALEG
ncbi:MAG TPA: shikimate dehydrogenase [Longimicrobium sp.]|nr:shikimate dehydrogenase [Longimicrobium sp.]